VISRNPGGKFSNGSEQVGGVKVFVDSKEEGSNKVILGTCLSSG